MGGAVDLHSHTTASDGTLGPAELVREAVRRGVRVLAVTDHDSTEGLAEAMAEAARHPPLQIVPGIEINCDVEGAEIHILGYCMDYEAAVVSGLLPSPAAKSGARASTAWRTGSPSSACPSIRRRSSPSCGKARRAARTSRRSCSPAAT